MRYAGIAIFIGNYISVALLPSDKRVSRLRLVQTVMGFARGEMQAFERWIRNFCDA
jgi:hypothetical protein